VLLCQRGVWGCGGMLGVLGWASGSALVDGGELLKITVKALCLSDEEGRGRSVFDDPNKSGGWEALVNVL